MVRRGFWGMSTRLLTKTDAQAFLDALAVLEAEHDVHLHASEWLSIVHGKRTEPMTLGTFAGQDGVEIECDDFG